VIRRIAAVVVLALVASGCATQLGRRTPACDINRVDSTLILQAQSVADAEYVPCVGELKAGWDYEHAVVRSGQSMFWISSDRVGERFLEVTLESTCDIGDAVRVTSDEDPVPLYVDIRQSDVTVSLVVVPEGQDSAIEAYASAYADQLRGTVLRDREVQVRVDLSTDTTSARIDKALAAGYPVLVVGAREQEEGLAELHLPGPDGAVDPVRVAPATALDAVEATLGGTRYEATWFYPFRSGCVTYEFDAEGPGVDTLPTDVQEALGLYPVDPLRAYGDQVGWVIP